MWNVVKDGMGWSTIPDNVTDLTENSLREREERGM
jgi:hypothetical protein